MKTNEKCYKFSDLNDAQKQIIAAAWCSNVAHFSLENCIVEYILTKSWEDNDVPFSYDDITNYENYGTLCITGIEYQLTESERDEKLFFYQYLQEKAETIRDQFDEQSPAFSRFDEHCLRFSEIVDELHSLGFDETPEIYQWFHCSRYACELLERAGQCTLDGSFWGRQCCGQSVELDYCIQKIAFDYYCDYGVDYITQTTIDAEKWEKNTFWGAA